MTDPLYRLAARAGLEPRYTDAFGQPREASRASVAATLNALGFRTDSAAAIRAELEALDRQARRLLEPVAVARDDAGTVEVAVGVPSGQDETLHWRLETEAGEILGGTALAKSLASGDDDIPRLRVPAPAPGYHRLTVTLGGESATQTLIVVPPACYQPPALGEDGRTWAVAAQLYTIRSAANWGIGDFTDLGGLAKLAKRLGAGAVALNPLHAGFLDDPAHASPYSPSGRRHFNPIYLDVQAIPEFADCEAARRRLADPVFQAELARLRAEDHVDHAGVVAAKRPVLEDLYRHFRARHLDGGPSERGAAFRAFQAAGGRTLWRFCVFHALRESFAAQDPARRDWRCWPAAWRDPDSEAVADFARREKEAVEFHAYLQWQTLAQLDRVQAASDGLEVGLITDLALGADAAGAETWSEPELYVNGVSLGAPPDELNLWGQDWGLPPMSPLALRERAHAPFVEVLRANMRHAGAIRIDHVLGLMRQYWVPAGFPASDGVYVRFPFEELLGVLALESRRQECLVIGEDLGTVPDGLRSRLREARVLSYRLLYFERDANGDFEPPEAWPREALVAATTHDLPTLPAYWQGADLELRQRLDLYPDAATYESEVERRQGDLARLRAALARTGLETGEDGDAPVLACYAYLARTPSLVLQVQLEDLLGETAPVNVPGTADAYPNWRRKLSVELDALAELPALHALAAALRRAGRAPEGPSPPEGVWTPNTTYRLQLNADLDFDAAAGLAGYLADLGISHVYASPYLRARQGSPHGYDIVDHAALNPEIGDAAALDRFVGALGARGLGQVLDFVPNHMGIGQSDNAAWLDVLRWGRASPHARMFDIDWRPAKPELDSRVLLPFLGDHYGVVLTAGALVPRFDADGGSFDIWYHEHCFPIAPPDYAELIAAGLNAQRPAAVVATPLSTLSEHFRRLQGIGRYGAETRRRGEAYRAALRHLVREWPEAVAVLEAGAAALAGTPGDAASFQPLHDLLERQAYRPAYWRVAASEINYRRFFDINELAGVRVEDAIVFDDLHRLVARLVAEGRLHGLRIDHVDGLRDPAGYLAGLRALLRRMRGSERDREAPYTIVEKILGPGERLPADWAVDGTTGYDFMNQVLGLFVDPAGQGALDRLHADLGGDNDFAAVAQRAKEQVIPDLFASELESLTTALDRLAEQAWTTRDYTRQGLHAALAAVAACFPVYRSYVTAGQGCREADRAVIARACARARAGWSGPDREVFDFLRAVLTGDLASDARYDAGAVLDIAERFQQFTGPVMAKSLEDTAFYRHYRLAALNEVGGDPGHFGTEPAAFHAANAARAEHWPRTMLATGTHDNKRGEDVRARLAVLSELADDWSARVRRWVALNEKHVAALADGPAPAPLDACLLYQTLVGAWPVTLLDAADLKATPEPLADFAARVQACMTKAGREAKLRTSWVLPDTAYEAGVAAFVARLLDPDASPTFLDELRSFARRVAWIGALNGLAQTVLKLTSPGVPDIYQGAEIWDLSLVDPDNRRPVDFAHRARLLADLPQGSALTPEAVAGVLADWPDGRIKLHVLHRLLRLRQRWPAVLREGAYEPLETTGPEAGRVVAFRRALDEREVVVAVGRLLAALYDGRTYGDWGGTTVRLPSGGAFVDALTGMRIEVPGSGELSAQQAFAVLPCAVLLRPEE